MQSTCVLQNKSEHFFGQSENSELFCYVSVIWNHGPIAQVVECPLGAGGCRFDSRPRHTKGIKNGTSNSLAGTHIKRVVLGR